MQYKSNFINRYNVMSQILEVGTPQNIIRCAQIRENVFNLVSPIIDKGQGVHHSDIFYAIFGTECHDLYAQNPKKDFSQHIILLQRFLEIQADIDTLDGIMITHLIKYLQFCEMVRKGEHVGIGFF